MTTKRVNAEIKSIEEAAERLLAGEVFYDKYNTKVRFDSTERNPFRYGNEHLSGVWETYTDWEIEVETQWYEEDDAFPRLCWVWDNVDSKREGIVYSYDASSEYPFRMAGAGRINAEPLTLEEGKHYIR